MDKYQFELNKLGELIKGLPDEASKHDDILGRLRSRASSAQSVGADPWVIDQIRFASSLLGDNPGLFRQQSRDLQRRLDILHALSDVWEGTLKELRATSKNVMAMPQEVIDAAAAAAAGALAALGLNQLGQKSDKTAAKTAKTVPVKGVPVGALTAEQIRTNLANLRTVPPKSQFGSSYKDASSTSDWNLDWQHGGDNCGPTSLAMVISYFESKKQPPGTGLTPLQAANWVRGDGNVENGAKNNLLGHNAGTNFGVYDGTREQNPTLYDTAASSTSLLGSHGLQMAHADRVGSLEDLRQQLDAGHPVVVKVDNHYYSNPGDSGATHDPPLYRNLTDVLTDHVVVVTGYDLDAAGKVAHVYINDPLSGYNASDRTHPTPDQNFQISAKEFEDAASKEYAEDPTKVTVHDWLGVGVSQKP